ncbi:MAG: PilZ domain-containing protein [Phycisphaeraceae bacterium]|nr:PilZ domain-containing protein [Phycisphaeraceae bacterium]
MCEGLSSDLGEVRDLSPRGCRIRGKSMGALPMGKTFLLSLTGEGFVLMIDARIVRRTRLSMFQHEYGLEFIDPTPEQTAMIGEIVKTTAVNRLIPTIDEAARRAM